ncbi:hypothetical protein OSTOST_15551, partial [Ostertagia ostertagi]
MNPSTTTRKHNTTNTEAVIPTALMLIIQSSLTFSFPCPATALSQIQFCAARGVDHSQCCEAAGISPQCLLFCDQVSKIYGT